MYNQDCLWIQSEIESERFQRRVVRGEVLSAKGVDSLVANIQQESPDLVILRISPQFLPHLKPLYDLGGDLIPADVSSTYRRVLEDLPPPPSLPNNATIRLAGHEDLEALDSITADAFSSYVTHYQCNPALPSLSSVDVYQDWNRQLMLSSGGGGALLYLIDNEPVGYLSWKLQEAMAAICLNGVKSGFSGGGIYSRLLIAGLHHFESERSDWVEVATQAHNLRVQKVWRRWGFEPAKVQITFHWNSSEWRGREQSEGGL